jgi:RHS repeat-associated protein
VANQLTSGSVDELLSRSDGSGTVVPLTDALGSVIAVTDVSGAIQTQYTFDPFGNTTGTGASSSNPYQFTSRENDGNGIYYYRARYYNPQFGRFISEDPISFAGGINHYAYAYDSPTRFFDPSGKDAIDYILPDWLYNHIPWNYVPAICDIDSFRFYGAGGERGNLEGGAFKLDDVHYSNTNAQGWHVDGMESDILVEGAYHGYGGGVVLDGRKPSKVKEGLAFVPLRGGDADINAGPAELEGSAELGGLAAYSKDGVSIGFYGEVGGGVGVGNSGIGGAVGGGWSVTFSSAASCASR